MSEEREMCPTCPTEPMKQRRAKCPMCNEWVYYTPEHRGHKRFYDGKWHKAIFKPADIAWIAHNSAHTVGQFMSLYEKVEP